MLYILLEVRVAMNPWSENKLFSSEETEKEVVDILTDSSLFSELEAEDRQELVSRLIALIHD